MTELHHDGMSDVMVASRTRLIRTQVQLTEEQTRLLRQLAAERGVSVAELVREAVEAMVRAGSGVPPEERRRRALEAVGRFASGRRDVGSRHDEYLVEAYHRRRADVR
jgi:hypothetical protein